MPKAALPFVAALFFACGNAPAQPATPPTATATATATDAAGVAPTSASGETTPAAPAAPAAPVATTGDDLLVSTVADPDTALAEAKEKGRGAVLVFCAQWAAACRDVDHAFADTDVKNAIADRFVAARIDVTNDEAPDVARHTKKYKVKGVPTILVYDKKGREVARQTSVVDGGALLQLLAKAK